MDLIDEEDRFRPGLRAPEPGFLGLASFEYDVSDGELSDRGLAEITVGGSYFLSLSAGGTLPHRGRGPGQVPEAKNIPESSWRWLENKLARYDLRPTGQSKSKTEWLRWTPFSQKSSPFPPDIAKVYCP